MLSGQAHQCALACPKHTGIHASKPTSQPCAPRNCPSRALWLPCCMLRSTLSLRRPKLMGTAHSAAVIIQALTYLGRPECKPAGKQCQNCAQRAPRPESPRRETKRGLQQARTAGSHAAPEWRTRHHSTGTSTEARSRSDQGISGNPERLRAGCRLAPHTARASTDPPRPPASRSTRAQAR